MQSQLPSNPQTVVASPTSEEGHSIISAPSSQSKEKKGWRRRDSESSQKSTKSKRKVHPSGGLASALAGSGLALANPAVQHPLVPPPVPRPRQNSTTSELASLPVQRNRHALAGSSRKPSGNFPGPPESIVDDNEAIGESGSDDSDEDDDSSPDELDLSEGAAPITGFAVASNKRTADFHALFPTVPEGDYLIDDYGCALQREILIQGRLYISENHICFHANIFGWTTDLVIPIEDITNLDKRMTAYVIPNAIQVSTHSGKYTFASLLSRDTTYDVIYNIWRSVRPGESLPGSPRGSLDGAGHTTSFGSVLEGVIPSVIDKLASGTGKPHTPTTCACGKEGKHLTELAMECIVPGEPEKIYNLMFASGFIKDFMRNDEKLFDIQISDWAPISEGSKMLTRNMSYIKPLAGGLGPKQTKCELKDEMVHLDYNDYITMITTTRTPDVPSGNVFSVQTRTCLMWAGAASTRIVVTSQVEWTGRSFIKGIIERSCIDGQKTYHNNLERGMRAYVANHKTEFLPQGVDGEVVEEAAAVLASAASPISGTEVMSLEDLRKAKEKERSQRGLQWALDTVEGTAKVARQSFTGAIELIKDTWESSSTTAVLWFVVVGLLLSNIWTYYRAGRLEKAARRKLGPRREEDIQRVVGESVRDAFRVFEEVVRGDGKSIVEEVAEVKRTLVSVDARVKRVEERLGSLD
ncbi:hypothetical protein K439DRAFT_1361765 [Ramaria rubella]|nr:hypothetical protein K439DRAFT_1361765 [Ramaria rubella]